LRAMGLNMMNAHRIDEVEDHAYQHAHRRLQRHDLEVAVCGS
jgi:hypothetical protein